MNKTRLPRDKYKFHFYTADFPEDFNAPNRSETCSVVNKPNNVDKTNKKTDGRIIFISRVFTCLTLITLEIRYAVFKGSG